MVESRVGAQQNRFFLFHYWPEKRDDRYKSVRLGLCVAVLDGNRGWYGADIKFGGVLGHLKNKRAAPRDLQLEARLRFDSSGRTQLSTGAE